jgi:hypothetical protein
MLISDLKELFKKMYQKKIIPKIVFIKKIPPSPQKKTVFGVTFFSVFFLNKFFRSGNPYLWMESRP